MEKWLFSISYCRSKSGKVTKEIKDMVVNDCLEQKLNVRLKISDSVSENSEESQAIREDRDLSTQPPL